MKAVALVPPFRMGRTPSTSEVRVTEVPRVEVMEGETEPTTVKEEQETPVVQAAEEVPTVFSLAGAVALPAAVQ
jgi:hypothetical protein